MHIKSVELRGFKSFAKKTRVTLEPGLLALVGPNGSGKSNIVDAILWVLGEQSAKLLRGSNMDDVIFAGSPSLPSLNAAEVTIVFDNSDKKIDLDFSEISVGRRLYRSGDSQYLINGSPCKLNNLRELLAEAALGKGLYSVISQGRIDEVLSGRPEDRRNMVDEAAGVLKHRLRKEKAVRKLKNIDEKILRAKDIHKEVKRQLNPLLKQAETAMKHKSLIEQLKDVEVRYNLCLLHKAKQQNDELLTQKKEVEEKKESINTELKKYIILKNDTSAKIEQSGESSRSVSIHHENFIRINEKFSGQLMLLTEKIVNTEREKSRSMTG